MVDSRKKQTSGVQPRTVALLLLAPLAISIAAWIFDIAITYKASASDLEGDYYLTGFVGTLGFIATGPLIGATLSRLVYERKLPFSSFLLLFFLVSLPILSFQILAYSSSIFSLFMIGDTFTVDNMTWWFVQATVLGVIVYFITAVILYIQAEYGVLRGRLTALLLAAGSFAVIAFRVLHS